jgi:hypothetical protein
MKRGIITSSGKFKRDGEFGINVSTLSQSDVNHYILYWDKIIVPNNNFIKTKIPQEEELINYGKLEIRRYNVPLSGSIDMFGIEVRTQSQLANEILAEKSEFDWTFLQISNEIHIAEKLKKEFNSIKVDLLNCLPVPNDDIKIDEVLSFKEKRKDELYQLHSTIDSLYLDILNSPDKDLTARKSLFELNQSIRNLDSVSKEKFKFLTKYNLTTELNLNGKDLITALASGAVFDFYTSGITIPIGTVVAGVASLIKVKANRTTSVEKADNKLKLNYLSQASKKRII